MPEICRHTRLSCVGCRQESRATLLGLEGGELHAWLSNLRVLEVLPVEQLVARAGKLYQRFKPAELLASRRITIRQCARTPCPSRLSSGRTLSGGQKGMLSRTRMCNSEVSSVETAVLLHRRQR